MPGPITPAYALMPRPAEKILTAWIRERPSALAVKILTPTTQERLLGVLRQIFSFVEELNVDREDIRKVLFGADSLQFSTATASDPNRRAAVNRLVWEATTLLGNAEGPVKQVLLAVHGGLEPALNTDELAQLLALATRCAGDQAEVILGHGHDARLGESIRVMLLVSR